jgi:hypothetical protein
MSATLEVVNFEGQSAYQCAVQRILRESSSLQRDPSRSFITAKSSTAASSWSKNSARKADNDGEKRLSLQLKILDEIADILKHETYSRMNAIKCRQLLYQAGQGM